MQTLLGGRLVIVPVGRVGNDAAGESVKQDLGRIGIDLAHVNTDESLPTLFSVCFAYPSGEGGNLTTVNSASAAVTRDAVAATEPVFDRFAHRGIAVAIPEVPLAARAELLRLATRYDFLRVGSFVAGELREPSAAALIRNLDLLAINVDEAAAFAGVSSAAPVDEIVAAAVAVARDAYGELLLVVTAGGSGSRVWDGVALRRDTGVEVRVVDAAGAGDAHLSGLLVALASGLAVEEANAFATVLSALKVTAPDTIAWGIDMASLEEAATAFERPMPRQLLTPVAESEPTLPGTRDRTLSTTNEERT